MVSAGHFFSLGILNDEAWSMSRDQSRPIRGQYTDHVIGQEWSCDLNIGFSLVESDHETSYWSPDHVDSGCDVKLVRVWVTPITTRDQDHVFQTRLTNHRPRSWDHSRQIRVLSDTSDKESELHPSSPLWPFNRGFKIFHLFLWRTIYRNILSLLF